MIGRLRPSSAAFLKLSEGFVNQETARRKRVDQCRTEVAPQISRDDDHLEMPRGQRGPRQVSTPGAQLEAARSRTRHGIENRLVVVVDAEGCESGCGQTQGMSSPPHGDVQRTTRCG